MQKPKKENENCIILNISKLAQYNFDRNTQEDIEVLNINEASFSTVT